MGPAELIRHKGEARTLMIRVSRNMMKKEQIEQVFESASHSVGLPASNEERDVIRIIAFEALPLRALVEEIDKELGRVGEEEETTHRIAAVIGQTLRSSTSAPVSAIRLYYALR